MIIVKGKVRGKARPRKGKHGFYTPNDTKKYEESIKREYIKQCNKKLDGPVEFILYIYKTKAKFTKKEKVLIEEDKYWCITKPDTDNVVKLVLDALNKTAYDDDNQVVKITALKKWTIEDERIEFIIQEI